MSYIANCKDNLWQLTRVDKYKRSVTVQRTASFDRE
jgi:hypothetical protein